MVWRKIDPEVCFLLPEVYSTERDAFDKAVHGKSFHFCPLEQRSFNFMGHHKCRSIKEESEVVRTKGMARHAICLEVFQLW